jgi:CRP-like cAMP-binding protein
MHLSDQNYVMIQSQAFLNFVHAAPGITPQEETQILACFEYVPLKNKEYFLREGGICNRIGYVNKGCLVYYRLLENGKKSVIQFAFEDWWVGDLDSFLNRKPAATFWQALEPAELICISRDDFGRWVAASEAFRSSFVTKTQTAYIKALERSAKDKSESAEEKYLRLLKEHPQIIRRVPHYDVAAYLGITAESLSRIRHKMATER